jgi:PKD repeat protein
LGDKLSRLISLEEHMKALTGTGSWEKKGVIPLFIRDLFPFLIAFFFLVLLITPSNAFPNGTETLITTDTTGLTDTVPAIDGVFIVYLENQNSLWLYNIESGETIPLTVSDPLAYYPATPGIAGDWIVWYEYDSSGSGKVSWYSIAGGMIQDSFDAADDTYDSVYPETDGTTLVWQNYNQSNGDWDIAILRGGTSDPELILCSANNEKHPAVDGSYVVYENWTDFDHAQVWQFNLADNTSVPVAGISDKEISPQISGNHIVWQARNDSDAIWHVEVSSSGITSRVSPDGVEQKNPAIDGDRIVVEDFRRDSTIPDIYLYEYAAGWTETWLAPNTLAASQLTPDIANKRIVWEDTRAGSGCGGCDSDIYLFTPGSSEICPVADFTPSVNAGPDPLAVTFTDRSSGSILYRIWNYSDGTTRYPLDPSGQTFSGAGIYHARLIVGNLKCRNMTPPDAKYDIYVDTPPDADFTAEPLSGFAPLAVQFTDTSGGDPATWTWDFGDGVVSHQQNPSHTYTTEGQDYTVSLTVNNTFAGMTENTETKTAYIRTFLGSTGTATLPIQGIRVIPRYGGWFLLYNATDLPDMTEPDPAVLIAYYPGSTGWQNITFVSSDANGFTDTYANNTYMGNLSRIFFQTDDVTTPGTSPVIGTGWGVSYRLESARYPPGGSVSTQIWESTVPADRMRFRSVIIGSNFIETPGGIAYTARITKSGISAQGNATINMSVDRSWLGGQEDDTYVIGYGTNSQGDTIGSAIPARYLFDDGTLDYFEAEVPEYYTTFGIAPLSGSGNPFQLITLSVTSHINPPEPVSPSSESDSGMPAGSAITAAMTAIPTTASTPVPTNELPDPGKSAKVYTNAQGVVTQATRLRSTDGQAMVALEEGVTAKDVSGKPLTEITIRSVPPEGLPAVPSGSMFTFAGMAYEVGPDGATFSPLLSITFTLPQAGSGQDYAVRMFDKSSGTWQDVPMTFDAATGTATVQVSHLCCFALFTPAHSTPVTTAAATTPLPLPAAPQAKAQPPSSAVSIFMSMIGWAAGFVMNNLVILVAVIILTTAIALILEDKFPGSRR